MVQVYVIATSTNDPEYWEVGYVVNGKLYATVVKRTDVDPIFQAIKFAFDDIPVINTIITDKKLDFNVDDDLVDEIKKQLKMRGITVNFQPLEKWPSNAKIYNENEQGEVNQRFHSLIELLKAVEKTPELKHDLDKYSKQIVEDKDIIEEAKALPGNQAMELLDSEQEALNTLEAMYHIENDKYYDELMDEKRVINSRLSDNSEKLFSEFKVKVDDLIAEGKYTQALDLVNEEERKLYKEELGEISYLTYEALLIGLKYKINRYLMPDRNIPKYSRKSREITKSSVTPARATVKTTTPVFIPLLSTSARKKIASGMYD